MQITENKQMNKVEIEGVGINVVIVNLIKEMYGATGEIKGNNFILEKATIKIGDILTRIEDVSLSQNSEQIALHLHELIPAISTEARKNLISKIPAIDFNQINYPTNKIFEFNDKMACAHNQDNIVAIAESAINFMKTTHNMLACHVVKVEAENFTNYIAAIKTLFLHEKFGPEITIDKIKKGILKTILPHAFEPLEYLDVFTRLSPFALSLPLFRYEGCMWHFYSDSIIKFKERWWLSSSFSEYMLSCRGPVTYSDTDLACIFGQCLSRLQQDDIKDCLGLMILAINNLFKFFLNMAFFTNEEGVVNKFKMIKSLSTLKLIFSDLREINYSVSIYHRNNFGLSALDKISNLISSFTEEKANEAELFKHFFSDKHKNILQNIYRNTMNNDHVASAFNDMVEACYENILESTCQKNYSDAADIIRNLRNLKHGAALKNEQYDKLFFTDNIDFPTSLTIFPFLTMLAISLDPERYFSDCH